VRETRTRISFATDAGARPLDDSQAVDTEEALMSIAKDFRYHVDVAWEGDRITNVSSPDKPDLTVATPPEFKNGVEGVWSPEDLLVAAAASCYAVTLVAVAEQRCLPLHQLNVSGTGHLTKRADGRFGFVAIELTATIGTEPASVEAVTHIAHYAERGCLISLALDIPVHVDVVVEPVEALVA
jgi:organic hydroperoxide reductase OsmC/OhrA